MKNLKVAQVVKIGIKKHPAILRLFGVFMAVSLLCPDAAYAIKQGGDAANKIIGIDAVWNVVQPYLTGLFSVGGVVYSGLNIRKVVIGDYRAAGPAALAALVAGVGINGMFGANALSVLLP